MKKNAVIALLSVVLFGFDSPDNVRVFLAGDSTMAEKPLVDNPERGWGQMIPMFFTRDVAFFNHARNGRSTRSFLLEGRWDSIIANVRPGDIVLIQFGHNDAKREDTSRFADANSDYKKHLTRFVDDVRKKNGIPVLITPVNRRSFDTIGVFTDKHGEYPDAVRAVAAQERVMLIDLHAKSKQLFETLGEKRSREYFLISVQPNRYRALPNGKTDNTHFTRAGAVEIARLVVDEIKKSDLSLKRHIVPEVVTLPEQPGIVVGLDQYYNNEWKRKNDTSAVRYHYTWNDSMDSGFSELGKMFDRNGADIDTLSERPTDRSLERFSIFIIVDPDTPKETAAPNYLAEEEIGAIERWVKNGGTLVLMGNDKGNAEFEHFNRLASRFGIRFNEDMHQDVKNNRYDSAKVAIASVHPAFRNVRHAFIKQFASIDVQPPAREMLRTRGAAVMAEASVGNGRVFAVGDPWLYNEYIDNRRLPSGYENYAAAAAWVHWLCDGAKKVR